MTERLTASHFRKAPSTPEEELAKKRAYYQRPEVKARYKERAQSEKHRAYLQEYRSRPEERQRTRERNRLKYGFPIGMSAALMTIQGGACAVCLKAFDTSKPRSIHADHCHASNTPRGLLCIHCNHAEGHIRRSGLTPNEFAQHLVDYLANPPANLFESQA